MNARQRIVVAVGAAVIALMAIFPPWLFILQPGSRPRVERFAGYHPIWQGNSPTDIDALRRIFAVNAHSSLFAIKLDTSRLCVQIIAIIFLATLLVVLFKASPKT